jgi:hypothetical protein
MKSRLNSKYSLFALLAVFCLWGSSCLLAAQDIVKTDAAVQRVHSTAGNLSVELSSDGTYQVTAGDPAWILKGKLPGPTTHIAVGIGSGPIGSSQDFSFTYTDRNSPVHAVIRLYDNNGIVSFQQTFAKASEATPSPFPDFTDLPQGLLPFSYRHFFNAPPQFRLENRSSP